MSLQCPRCKSVEVDKISSGCSCGAPKYRCKKCGFQSLERFFDVV